jgi:hypothetical protein
MRKPKPPPCTTEAAILKAGPPNWSRMVKVAGALHISLPTLDERYKKPGYLFTAKVPVELATLIFPAGCEVTTADCLLWAMKCREDADRAKANAKAKADREHLDAVRRELRAGGGK